MGGDVMQDHPVVFQIFQSGGGDVRFLGKQGNRHRATQGNRHSGRYDAAQQSFERNHVFPSFLSRLSRSRLSRHDVSRPFGRRPKRSEGEPKRQDS